MPVVHGDNFDNVLHYDNTYTVYGHGNSDSISGGAMYGGPGDDYYHVDSATDVIVEYANEGNDSVFSWIKSYTLTSHVENLYLETGSVAETGTGNGLANKISGNELNNILNGQGGHDELIGDFGNDTITGGGGHDRIIGFSYTGANEIDNLKGDAGFDTFVLHYTGANNTKLAAYNDGIYIGVGSAGLTDYARIRNFNKSEDMIELAGSSSNYLLQQSPISLGTSTQDTAIYQKGVLSNELIAVIQDVPVNQLNLSGSGFAYVV